VKEAIRAALAAYTPSSLDPDTAGAPAAVLVLLYEHNDDTHIVFQKRTDSVRDHKGQISFPGGAADSDDPDLPFTALRETHEEIGVDPGDVDMLGVLDELLTISNYRVRPFVGWLSHYPYEWKFSDHEVAYLLEVPLSHLLNPATLVPDRRTFNGREIVFQSYQFGDDLIWGATARMLSNFLDVCLAIPGFGAGAVPAPSPVEA
jgi:8-oxo-dGTP pyrophosphatase MutT (NUDIX family)